MVFCSSRRFVAPDSPSDSNFSGGTRRASFQFEIRSGREPQLWREGEQALDNDLRLHRKGEPYQVSPVSANCTEHGLDSEAPRQVICRSSSDDDFNVITHSNRVVINCTCTECQTHRSKGQPKTGAGQHDCIKPHLRAKTSFEEAMMNAIVDFDALRTKSNRSADGRRGRTEWFLAAIRELSPSRPRSLSKVKHRLQGKQGKTDKQVAAGSRPKSALGVPPLSNGLSASTHDLVRPNDGEWLGVDRLERRRKSHSWHGSSIKDMPHEISYHSSDWQAKGFAFLAPVHAFTAPEPLPMLETLV